MAVRQPTEVDINTDGHIQPVMDTYEEYNNPYRGPENHGVELKQLHQDPEDELLYDGEEPDVDVMDDDIPDPVPVFIVESGRREKKRWRNRQLGVGTDVVQIASQRDNRTRILIKNMAGTGDFYIGSDYNYAGANVGYPLSPGEELELFTDGAIYATHETGVEVIAVLEEYNVFTGDE